MTSTCIDNGHRLYPEPRRDDLRDVPGQSQRSELTLLSGVVCNMAELSPWGSTSTTKVQRILQVQQNGESAIVDSFLSGHE